MLHSPEPVRAARQARSPERGRPDHGHHPRRPPLDLARVDERLERALAQVDGEARQEARRRRRRPDARRRPAAHRVHRFRRPRARDRRRTRIHAACFLPMRMPAPHRLGLPEYFIFTMGSIAPRKGVADLIRAMALPGTPRAAAARRGPRPLRRGQCHRGRRVRRSSRGPGAGARPPRRRRPRRRSRSRDDLRLPEPGGGVRAADRRGVPLRHPVIHSDDPAILEVSGGAGLSRRARRVRKATRSASPPRSARVLEDGELRARLAVHASDRRAGVQLARLR